MRSSNQAKTSSNHWFEQITVSNPSKTNHAKIIDLYKLLCIAPMNSGIFETLKLQSGQLCVYQLCRPQQQHEAMTRNDLCTA